jgi:hypothetical protein
MPLLFNVANLPKEPPMFVRQFLIAGDGDSTRLRVDLEKSPVAMEFKLGNMPSMAFMRSAIGSNCEVILRMEGSHLVFEFSKPPVVGERVEIIVEFYYESEELETIAAETQTCNIAWQTTCQSDVQH